MKLARTSPNSRQRGFVLIMSLVLVALFSTFAVSMATLSGANLQMAQNQRKVNSALYAAQSGLECAKYLVSTVALAETSVNVVTNTEADQVWTDLIVHLQTSSLDGQSAGAATSFTDAGGVGRC